MLELENNSNSGLELLLNPSTVKAKFDIHDHELSALQQFGQTYLDQVLPFIHDYYEWMHLLPEFSEFFTSSMLAEQIKQQQIYYWRELLEGKITKDYLNNRVLIGRAYARIGLPIYSYCAAMNYAFTWWKKKIEEFRALQESVQQGEVNLGAVVALIFHKLIQLDITIITQAYYLNTQDKLQMSLKETQKIVDTVTKITKSVVAGNYSIRLEESGSSLNSAINQMIKNLDQSMQAGKRDDWIKNGQTQLAECLTGDHSVDDLANKIITFLASYLNAKVGIFYIASDNKTLKLIASYAYKHQYETDHDIKLGEGLTGQAVLEKKVMVINDLPHNYLPICSGLGETKSASILIVPIVLDGTVKAVIELGNCSEFNDLHMEFMKIVTNAIAISVESAVNRKKLRELLEESQQKSKKLEVQQIYLETINRDLEEKATELRNSETELKSQSKKLQLTNEELEEKTRVLEEQKRSIEMQNKELEESKKMLETKAEELQLSGKYKTEFLSNISHELRTPLNSLLILAKTFELNELGNLTDDQIKSAKIIYNSGKDLLNLINDILDLSKVEAGKMTINIEEFNINAFISSFYEKMLPAASAKNITFDVSFDENISETFVSDLQRIEQILKNIISNAIKFTEKNGKVNLKIYRPDESTLLSNAMSCAPESLAFTVSDTGIGIEEKDRLTIFEAFRQGDGSVSRKYGGTGLGLTISQKLAKLLGGKIILEEGNNEGATFTLYLTSKKIEKNRHTEGKYHRTVDLSDESVPDQEKKCQALSSSHHANGHLVDINVFQGKKILLVDDDMRNNIALGSTLRKQGFEILTADNGELAIEFMEKDENIDLVLMDIMMPIMDGYTTIQKIRESENYQGIPIVALTANAMTEDREKCLESGADDYLVKPIDLEKLLEIIKLWINKK